MEDTTAEKLAELLADCAVTGDAAGLVKRADLDMKSLVLPLVSAAGGGAAGYMLTDKEKDKQRNALYGALTGGLSGAGVQLALPLAKDYYNYATGAAPVTSVDDVTKPRGAPITPKAPAGTGVAGTAGGIAGGIGGWLTRRRFDSPLEGAAKLTTGAGKNVKPHPAADFFKKLIEFKTLGRDAQHAVPRQHADQLRQFLANSGDVNLKDPKIREMLEAAYKRTSAGGKGSKTLPSGTMTELLRLQSNRPGRFMRGFRGAVRGGVGGYAGSVISDRLYRTLANMWSGAPEAADKSK
jgi:hypothetical protein